jgi:hypothetical protein
MSVTLRSSPRTWWRAQTRRGDSGRSLATTAALRDMNCGGAVMLQGFLWISNQSNEPNPTTASRGSYTWRCYWKTLTGNGWRRWHAYGEASCRTLGRRDCTGRYGEQDKVESSSTDVQARGEIVGKVEWQEVVRRWRISPADELIGNDGERGKTMTTPVDNIEEAGQ